MKLSSEMMVALMFILQPSLSRCQSIVELSGFRAGMTPAQVRSTLKPGYHETSVSFDGKEAGGFIEQKGNDLHDVFFFTFFNNQLVSVSHHIEFPAGQEISRTQFLKDLVLKYGKRTMVPNETGQTAQWHPKNGSPADYSHTLSYMVPSCIPQHSLVSDHLPQSLQLEHGRNEPYYGFAIPTGNGPCAQMDVISTFMRWRDTSDYDQLYSIDLTLSNETPVHDFLVAQRDGKVQQDRNSDAAAQKRHAPL